MFFPPPPPALPSRAHEAADFLVAATIAAAILSNDGKHPAAIFMIAAANETVAALGVVATATVASASVYWRALSARNL